MYLPIYLYLYLYIYLYLYFFIYLYLSVSICIYLYISVSIYIYLFLSVSICIYLYLSVCICCICIYLYLSVSICIYIFSFLSVSIYLSISTPCVEGLTEPMYLLVYYSNYWVQGQPFSRGFLNCIIDWLSDVFINWLIFIDFYDESFFYFDCHAALLLIILLSWSAFDDLCSNDL